MDTPKRHRYLRSWPLLVILWWGACTGVQERLDTTQHYYDKTEADLEYGRPEAAARYHRPRGAQRYGYDKTESDLTRPLQQREEQHMSPPPSRSDAPPTAPLPDGGR